MTQRLLLTACLALAACVAPPDDLQPSPELDAAARGGGSGGGSVPDPYLGFLDELSRPGGSIDTNVRAGMVDARIFWATGNPVPSSISIPSALPSSVAAGAGGYTYPTGERQNTKPTGYRLPLVFDVPRSAIGSQIVISAQTANQRGSASLTQTLTVVDAPSRPTGVVVEKAGASLVVRWAPSEFGVGRIHYIVENLSCVTPRVCSGVTVADTFDTTVTFTRTQSLLRIRAVADNADSTIYEQDISAF